MNNVEAHRRIATITAVARQLAMDMAAMTEAPPDKISKFSTYVIGLASDPVPKVGRCAVPGWGVAQQRHLVKSAREAAIEIPGALATAIVSKHATPESPSVEVSVFASTSEFTISFPCSVAAGSLSYQETDESANKRISDEVASWVEQLASSLPKRKKFLGLF